MWKKIVEVDGKGITKDMIKTKTLKKNLTNHMKSDIIDKLLYGAEEITERKNEKTSEKGLTNGSGSDIIEKLV